MMCGNITVERGQGAIKVLGNPINPQDIPRKITEDFIADVRRLILVHGTQSAAGRAVGVSWDSLHRWSTGSHIPSFAQYLLVKRAIGELIVGLNSVRQRGPNAERQLDAGQGEV